MKWHQWIGALAGAGLMFGSAAVANPAAAMEQHGSTSNGEFARIEQPLGVKLGVSAVGLGLIGLELWWFLFSKPRSQKAQSQQGVQELNITVDGGYEPNQIVVQAGKPVRLNFFRQDPNDCLEQVVIPDFQIAQTLPLNQRTRVEFTPQKAGEYIFTCGMKMFRGVIRVE